MTHTRLTPAPVRSLARAVAATAAVLALVGPAAALAAPDRPADSSRAPAITDAQVLPEEDGWASAEGGTTGGAAATPDRVYDVSTRSS